MSQRRKTCQPVNGELLVDGCRPLRTERSCCHFTQPVGIPIPKRKGGAVVNPNSNDISEDNPLYRPLWATPSKAPATSTSNVSAKRVSKSDTPPLSSNSNEISEDNPLYRPLWATPSKKLTSAEKRGSNRDGHVIVHDEVDNTEHRTTSTPFGNSGSGCTQFEPHRINHMLCKNCRRMKDAHDSSSVAQCRSSPSSSPPPPSSSGSSDGSPVWMAPQGLPPSMPPGLLTNASGGFFYFPPSSGDRSCGPAGSTGYYWFPPGSQPPSHDAGLVMSAGSPPLPSHTFMPPSSSSPPSSRPGCTYRHSSVSPPVSLSYSVVRDHRASRSSWSDDDHRDDDRHVWTPPRVMAKVPPTPASCPAGYRHQTTDGAFERKQTAADFAAIRRKNMGSSITFI